MSKEKEAPAEGKKESDSEAIKVKSLEQILREKALKKLMERRQKLSEDVKTSGENVEANEEVKKVDGKRSEEEIEEKSVEEPKEAPKEDSNLCVATSRAENEDSSEIKESKNKASSPRKRVLAVVALKSVIGRTVIEGSVNNDKPSSPPASDEIKVKTFEEIMKEKKLRRNQLGKQNKELGNVCNSVQQICSNQATKVTIKILTGGFIFIFSCSPWHM